MQTILNNDKDAYLVSQRRRNTRDIARTLRKFNKYFMIRDLIPLDETLYPDVLLDDFMAISRLATKVITYLEEKPHHDMALHQLEFSFCKDDPNDR
jgi:hypothetical protein